MWINARLNKGVMHKFSMHKLMKFNPGILHNVMHSLDRGKLTHEQWTVSSERWAVTHEQWAVTREQWYQI
jgi:hypothetical protein